MALLGKNKNLVESFALNLFLIASIVITPFYSFESINLPKFVVLIFFGCVALIYISINFKIVLFRLPKISILLLLGFIITYMVVFIASDTPWQQQLYGRENRRNGLLTHFSLILVFIIFHRLPYAKYLKKFVNRIVYAGLFVIIYALLQLLGVDPFKWDSVNLHFFSTLGNPNFLSAYIAAVTIPILSRIYSGFPPFKLYVRLVLVLMALLILSFLIFRTFSYQGFISLFASLSAFALIIIYRNKKLKLFFATFIFTSIFGLIAFAGTLNHGPLATILYKSSITSRGDFFRAAVNSGNSNFLTGTGFDSFGDYYLLYRDKIAGSRSSAEFTDSAHNYFLDLYATQGFFGILFYLLLTLITLISFFKIFKCADSPSDGVVLFSIWIAIQFQSLVSPTNFLFLILIFSISGLVIGSARDKEQSLKPITNGLSLTLGFLLCLVISISAISRENQILVANQKGSPDKYISALEIFPKSTVGYSRAINLFAQAGFETEALELSRKALEFNRRTPAAHLVIFTSPFSSEEEKIIAYKALLELDPMNPKIENLRP